MHTVTVQGQTKESRITVGECLSNVAAYLPDRRVIIITDEVVGSIYRKDFPTAEVITIGCGEKNKTMETLADIYGQLIAMEADRSIFILGVGGGIVGDITGFAASTYMRGVPFGFVATTLLAQVDATVGGKNGVNFQGYKNMVGVFAQPDFVIADIAALATLPSNQIVSGLAEIVKHGCIADEAYLSYIENHRSQIATLDPEVMTHLVHESVKIKAAVVNQDEKEAGERRKLNFGHTYGHALEKSLGLSHGEAVSVGMTLACRFSRAQGYLDPASVTRVEKLLADLNLPVMVDFDAQVIFNALKKDKKRAADNLHFVFLDRLGHALVQSVPVAQLGRWLTDERLAVGS